MQNIDAWRMIKRLAQAIGMPEDIGNHTFRATGITACLENGGTIERARPIANHESPKTTELYDRTGNQIDLDEIEKIRIRTSYHLIEPGHRAIVRGVVVESQHTRGTI
jgi:integrase